MRRATQEMKIGGVILCGGRSSRMETDKSQLIFAGECLLQRVTRIVTLAAAPTVVVAAGGQVLCELGAEVEVVRDRREGRGPLEGMFAGLERLAGRCDAAFVAGCDHPFLSSSAIRAMADRLGGCEAAVARFGGERHPLSAVYRISVVDKVRDLLSRDCRSLQALLDACRCRIIEEKELEALPGGTDGFVSVNTPQEYAAAQTRFEQWRRSHCQACGHDLAGIAYTECPDCGAQRS